MQLLHLSGSVRGYSSITEKFVTK